MLLMALLTSFTELVPMRSVSSLLASDVHAHYHEMVCVFLWGRRQCSCLALMRASGVRTKYYSTVIQAENHFFMHSCNTALL